METNKDTLKRISELDPISHSDNYSECFFCGGWYAIYSDIPNACYHKIGCSWIQAWHRTHNTRHEQLDPVHKSVGQEPMPVHGPPKPRELMSILERTLDDMKQAYIKELSRPLLLDNIPKGTTTFNVSRSTKFD